MTGKIFSFLTLFFILFWVSGFSAAEPRYEANKRLHIEYFEDTDYELHVYKIFGEEKGKTIMIIGGIQGDEPGGFLTADSYIDLSLERGNLIVVPRANLLSILLQKRSINVDMNRKFGDNDAKEYEGKIVKILKELIAESDCLLNLHDGSGFFSPVWIDNMKNPMRFGQSVITDFAEYKTLDGRLLDLKNIVERVLFKVNLKIKNKALRFKFNNHRTSESNSIHKDQRKSATFYAVTKCNIPAFGIETSKSLTLMQKVKYHQYVINAFLEEFGVIPSTPSLRLEKPELKYFVLSINGRTPIVVEAGSSIILKRNSRVRVSHVEANYDRGLIVDIVGAGQKNDLRKEIFIIKDTRIVAKKDSEPCGSVFLKVSDDKENIGNDNKDVYITDRLTGLFFFKVSVNGKINYIDKNSTLSVSSEDHFKIIDIITTDYDPAVCKVNIKGYSNSDLNNTGEDRGFDIDSSKDLWKKYSVHKKGEIYPVEVSMDNQVVAEMFIHIKGKETKYLLVKSSSGAIMAVEDGKTFKVTGKVYLYDFLGIHDPACWLEINHRKFKKKDMPVILSDDLSEAFSGTMNIFLCRNIAGRKHIDAEFTLSLK